MLLTVESPGFRREIEIAPGEKLTDRLAVLHLPLDTRCGGRGTCGRCRVRLLAGIFRTDAKEIAAPAEVNGCRTELLSGTGRIFIPAGSLLGESGQIESGFHFHQLPDRPVLAIDIGTTTIAAALLRDGRVAAVNGGFNGQFPYGDNVASRISFAAEKPEQLELLRLAVVRSINRIIDGFPDLHLVTRIAVGGNTVMSCLFHGIDPAGIGVMPFTPPCRDFPARPAGRLGLAVNPETEVLTIPAVSGYIGGDLTGGILLTELDQSAEPVLLVDLGTNCEIILNTGKELLCAAAAAGPAFEGAGITAGSRAVAGAIDRLTIEDGSAAYHVIGEQAPTGICGSAYVEFLASARKTGLLNEFGRLQSFETTPDGLRFFRITNEIVITEGDIEQLLKAKAAVYAGIQSLLEQAGVALSQLKRVYLAGGFSRYLDLEAARRIGMLPGWPDEVFQIVGNTSLGSAARLAAEPELLPRLRRISDAATEIPLNTIAGFEDHYIDALMFPEK